MNWDLSDNLGKTIDGIQSMGGQLYQIFANSETEQIGEQFYLTEHKYGIGLVFSRTKHLIAIHLHAGGNSYSSYKGELPFDLCFSDSVNEAHRKIGVSHFETGGEEVLPMLGYVRLWRKYKTKKFYIHLEFHDKGQSIALITISPLS